jgi:hypothetical protein
LFSSLKSTMNDTLYEALVQRIHRHKTWVDVHSSTELRSFLMHTGKSRACSLARVLILRSRYALHGSAKGRQWIIPEYELDKALRALRSEHVPATPTEISATEAEEIVRRATYGLLHLELAEEPTSFPD